jgi:hypothetical protein
MGRTDCSCFGGLGGDDVAFPAFSFFFFFFAAAQGSAGTRSVDLCSPVASAAGVGPIAAGVAVDDDLARSSLSLALGSRLLFAAFFEAPMPIAAQLREP